MSKKLRVLNVLALAIVLMGSVTTAYAADFSAAATQACQPA